jgi:sugar phosphate isomerase/epimerase
VNISRRKLLGAVPAGLAILDRLAAAPPPMPCGCRDAMLRELGVPDCWTAAKFVGAEVIEVTVDDKFALPLLMHPQRQYSIATDESMKQLSDDLHAAGVKISAFCVASRFDTRPDFECDFGAKLARISQQLGVRAIRIDVVASKLTTDQFLDPAVAALKKLIEATEGTGIRFGVENHGHFGNNPGFLSPLLDRVGSKRLGVTLDTGNFYWFGHPLSKVYELIETFAPRVVHTHCKNIGYPEDQREVQRPIGWEYAKYEAPIDQGDIDFTRVVKILRAAGYSGDLCVENEALRRLPEGERSGVLAREIAYLKRLRTV